MWARASCRCLNRRCTRRRSGCTSPPHSWKAWTISRPLKNRTGTGLGNALRSIAALRLMCDPRDLGVALGSSLPDAAFEPDLYLYDNYPGGIGQSAPLYEMTDALLRDTAELLARCPCGDGCPSCVGPVGEIGERGKMAAMRILGCLCRGPA